MKKFILPLILILLVSANAKANYDLGLEGNFFNSAHTLNNEKNTQLIFGDAYIALTFVDKGKTSFIFNYTFLQESYKSDATTDVTIAHLGPLAGLRTNFWEVFYLTVMGTPYIQANYQVTGNPKEQWSGWAYQVRLSLEGKLNYSLGLIASLNYFSAYYNQKSSNAVSTQSTFSRSIIVPAAGFVFKF